MPIADFRLPTAECRMPIAECRLPTAECRMPIAECRLPTQDGTIADAAVRRRESGRVAERQTQRI